MKVTITWSAWMTLTSFPELAIGDNGDDKDKSGDEKVKVEMTRTKVEMKK